MVAVYRCSGGDQCAGSEAGTQRPPMGRYRDDDGRQGDGFSPAHPGSHRPIGQSVSPRPVRGQLR